MYLERFSQKARFDLKGCNETPTGLKNMKGLNKKTIFLEPPQEATAPQLNWFGARSVVR